MVFMTNKGSLSKEGFNLGLQFQRDEFITSTVVNCGSRQTWGVEKQLKDHISNLKQEEELRMVGAGLLNSQTLPLWLFLQLGHTL